MTTTAQPDISFKLYCYRCGHFWSTRGGRLPKMCPRCKSSQWDTPVRRNAECKKCGNVWQMSMIDEPCPSCGYSRFESNPSSVLHCNQCDHEWVRRSHDKLPNKCPVCKTTKWNEEKIPQFTCRICGYVWRAQMKNPKRCPRCQSGKWNMLVYKLQCRRCGHKWVAKEGRTSEDVKMCPACKSRKWREVPKPVLCNRCGTYYINRSKKSSSRCPTCNSKAKIFENTCEFCKTVWMSTCYGDIICPICGKPKLNTLKDRTMDIWKGGGFSLRYTYANEFASIYLWEGDVPVATIYFHDLLRHMGMNAEQFTISLSDPGFSSRLENISKYMYEHRDDYMSNVSYFISRLNICRYDAEVLAIHFTGMGPEAIALKFGVPIDDIRRSFDRIMAAYTDNGIIVNDSIFTDDPLSLY